MPIPPTCELPWRIQRASATEALIESPRRAKQPIRAREIARVRTSTPKSDIYLISGIVLAKQNAEFLPEFGLKSCLFEIEYQLRIGIIAGRLRHHTPAREWAIDPGTKKGAYQWHGKNQGLRSSNYWS